MSYSYTICSTSDVRPITRGCGGGGAKYPWFDEKIGVGQGFHVARSQEDVDADRGRPTVPTQKLASHGMKYKTYKATFKGIPGYMCERVI